MNVSLEEARRIAVRAQALDGSATGVLETVRRLGFLQIDVVAPVERPQHLVLFSRLGPGYDRAELDRLLWEERALFEWDAFIYPIEDLPLVRARIRNFRRSRQHQEPALGRRVPDGEPRLQALRPPRARAERADALPRPRGPLEGRDARSTAGGAPSKVGLMLLSPPHLRRDHRRRPAGRRAAVGSHLSLVAGDGDALDPGRGRDPRGAALPDARREARQGRSGTRIRTPRTGRYPTAPSSSPPSTAWSTTATAPRRCGTSATGSRCSSRRRSASTATTCCRSWSATRSSAGPSRASTRRPATLELLGAWGDTSRLDEALADLAAWLGAASIKR